MLNWKKRYQIWLGQEVSGEPRGQSVRKETNKESQSEFDNLENSLLNCKHEGNPRGKLDDPITRHCLLKLDFFRKTNDKRHVTGGVYVFKDQKIRDVGKTIETELIARPWHIFVGGTLQAGHETQKPNKSTGIARKNKEKENQNLTYERP